MADVHFTEKEVKEFLKDGIALHNATTEEAIDYYTAKYGAVKGAKAYKIFSKVKAGIASIALTWDNDKTVGENIAYISGEIAQNSAITGVGVLVGVTGALELFAIGYLGNKALRHWGSVAMPFS